MIIKFLDLKNFRNYSNLTIELSEKTNILYGKNAQGKTNILESIYMCSTTKSHRGNKDKEIIKFNENEAHIKIILEKNKINHRIDFHLKKDKTKGIAINGFPIKRHEEIFGLLNVVLFSPEDLDIIKRGPKARRKFLDIELCQINKIYLYNLSNYNKIIMQRNNLLKQINKKRELIDTLDIWDEKLLDHGKTIIKLREEFISNLNEIVKKVHSKLTNKKEELNIYYNKNVKEEDFNKRLKDNREKDIYIGSTSYGPHKDDISFIINDIDIKIYGSQGQQRTVALSLKLAEIELVKKIIKDKPILLLDDVLSELDRSRQEDLLNNIGEIQTILTCTGLEEFISNRFEYNKIFHIVEGKIESNNYLFK